MPWRPRKSGVRAALLDAQHGIGLETQVRRLALAPAREARIVEAADLERLVALLAATAHASDAHAARVGRRARQRVLGFEVDEHQAAAAIGHLLELGDLERQDAPARRGAAHMGRGNERLAAAGERRVRRPAELLALAQRDEGLAAAVARGHVLHGGDEAVAARTREQQRRVRGAREIVHRLRAGLQIDQRGDGLAIAARAGQLRDGHGIHAAVAAEGDERIDGAALEGAIERVAGFESEGAGIVAVALARAHPALLRNDHRHGLIDHLHLGRGALVGLDERAARVRELLRVRLDLLDHQAAQRCGVGKDVLELALLLAQFLEFLLDLDGLEPRELAQADFQDVLGLPLRQVEARHQRGPGLVARADDGDHLVDVEQHGLPPLEDVDAVQHLGEAVLAAPRDGLLAEGDPFLQHAPQRLLHGFAVQAHHGQVDGRGGFQAGVRQQRGDEFLLRHLARLGLEHDAHGRILARLVAHHVQHAQHRGLELRLLLRERLLAGLDLGIGELLDLFQHLLRGNAGRQLGHHHLPLAPRQVLDLPARAHLEAAAPRAVGVLDVARAADDLAAARVVRARHDRGEFLVGELRVLHQRHAGVGDLAQVVARNLGGQAHGDAASAVQQCERQARGQLARLLGGAVVIGHEIDRTLVDFLEQQAGDTRQPRLGVAHGCGAVAIAAAEVALAVDERIALAEILRQPHQRVVGRLVAMRMEAAQHVAHHAGAFHGLGRHVAGGPAIGQAHALHREEDAALHRLHAVAHVRQRAALHHGERVLQVGALRVAGQAQVVAGLGLGEVEGGLVVIAHASGRMERGTRQAVRRGVVRKIRARPGPRVLPVPCAPGRPRRRARPPRAPERPPRA